MTRPKPFAHEENRQVAALCWRRHPLPEVLLVTSLRTRRWILPKGWLHPNLSPPESAAREALEEAGVIGTLDAAPLGTYHYLKEKAGNGIPCAVTVFALEVTQQKRNWPEGERDMLWLPLAQAAQRVAEPGLRAILLDFRRRLRSAA